MKRLGVLFAVLAVACAPVKEMTVYDAGYKGSACAPRAKFERVLFDKYGETITSAGLLTGGGAIITLYLSPGGSFTLTLTNKNGVSCLVAAGARWRALKPPRRL